MRKAVGLPAVTLAELLDTSPETVSRWERGVSHIDRAAFAILAGIDRILSSGSGPCVIPLVSARWFRSTPDGISLLLVVLREPSAEIHSLWGALHPAREARARRPEEGGSTRPPFGEPGRLQPVLTSQLYDQLPKGAIALHQGVRLPHVAEVEGAHSERWNSPCRDSFGDCSQRRVGER